MFFRCYNSETIIDDVETIKLRMNRIIGNRYILGVIISTVIVAVKL